jgi:hypothetical protein
MKHQNNNFEHDCCFATTSIILTDIIFTMNGDITLDMTCS